MLSHPTTQIKQAECKYQYHQHKHQSRSRPTQSDRKLHPCPVPQCLFSSSYRSSSICIQRINNTEINVSHAPTIIPKINTLNKSIYLSPLCTIHMINIPNNAPIANEAIPTVTIHSTIHHALLAYSKSLLQTHHQNRPSKGTPS